MRQMVLAGILALGLGGHAAAQERELALGGGEVLPYTYAGYVSVAHTATAFGLSIRPEVMARSELGKPSARAITDADYARACRAVLAPPDARLGGRAPEHVFFQVAAGRLDLGIIDLDRTEEVFFEMRRGACIRMTRAPEETK